MSSNSDSRLSSFSVDVAFLRSLKLFEELDEQSLGKLMPSFVRSAATGRALLDVDQWTGKLVYLIRGELKMQYADGSTAVLVGGSDDARQPLGKWGLPLVSAKAINDVELLSLDEERFEIVLIHAQLTVRKSEPDREGTSSAQAPGGLSQESEAVVMALQALAGGVFNGLPHDDLRQLLKHFEQIPARRGDTLVRQDEEGDYYYLIETGRCLVTRTVAGAPMVLAELKAGDAFGEEALLTDLTRNATVTMKSDGTLLRLAKKDFIELLRSRLLNRISYVEACRRVAAGALWLDVRFAAEHQYDGIPGSRNISLNTIREASASLDPGQEYIVYCQNGRRSAAAAFLLAQRGFNASLLEGGLLGNKDTGQEAVIL